MVVAQVRELGDLAAKFGVEKLPTLLVACNGDPGSTEAFQGDFKSGPVTDFLNRFAGGRKCASAVKVNVTFCLQTLNEEAEFFRPLL